MMWMSRLESIHCGAGLLAVGLLATAASAHERLPAFPEDPKSHEWVKAGEGIYAFISPSGITPLVSGNSVVVIGDASVLVVDTGQFPSLARAEIAEIQRLTPLPVRYIVTTHWHPDHWTGNGEFKRAYPGVEIISTQYTRAQALARGASFVAPDYSRTTLEYIDKTLARDDHSSGPPLPPGVLSYLQMAKRQFVTFDAELASVTLTFPDVTFSESLDVHLGKRLVQIKFLGRGNTGGDAVVYVPDAAVLVTGDLVVSPFPYGAGSFYGEWLSTLRKLAALDARTVVPGHGAIEHDKVYLLRLIRLLEELRTDVAAAVTAGLSVEEAQQKITLANAVSELCGSLEFRDICEYSFTNNFVKPAVARSYKEQKEGPLPSEE